MKYFSPLRMPTITIAFALLALISGGPESLHARQQPRPDKPPADPSASVKARAMADAINQRVRELGLIAVTEDDEQAAFVRRRRDAQLSEDFNKLYSINVETIATQSSAPSLDYKILSDATADLKVRATRIKYNVPLLRIADKGEKIRYDEYPNCLQSMLPELTRLIDGFLSSPVFRLSSPNDAALRIKASRDLDGIIKLSETINKIAKRSTSTAESK